MVKRKEGGNSNMEEAQESVARNRERKKDADHRISYNISRTMGFDQVGEIKEIGTKRGKTKRREKKKPKHSRRKRAQRKVVN